MANREENDMPSEVAKRLRDRRLNVWNEAKGLAESAATENRALTDEEQGKWDALQEEMSKLDTRIRAVLDTEKRAKDADDAFDQLSGRKPDHGQAQRTAGGPKILEDVRKWARGDEGASRGLEVRRDPGLGPINYRVLTAGTAGTASSIIPTDFYDMLIAHLIEVSGVMQCGPTVLNTGGGETLQVPKTTAHSTAASAAQAAGLPTSDPGFSMQPLSAYKYGVMLQVARELIDDTAVDLLGYLAMQAGRALGNSFGIRPGERDRRQPAVRHHQHRHDRRHRIGDRGVRRAQLRQPGRPRILGDRPLPSVTKLLLAGSGQDNRRFSKDYRHSWTSDLGAFCCSGLPGSAARQAAGRRPVHAGDGHLGQVDRLR